MTAELERLSPDNGRGPTEDRLRTIRTGVDGVADLLTALHMSLQYVRQTWTSDPEASVSELDNAITLCSEAIAGTRKTMRAAEGPDNGGRTTSAVRRRQAGSPTEQEETMTDQTRPLAVVTGASSPESCGRTPIRDPVRERGRISSALAPGTR